MWTRGQLIRLCDMNRRGRLLVNIAPFVGHDADESDVALWEMLGRTLPQALAILNSRAEDGRGVVPFPVAAR